MLWRAVVFALPAGAVIWLAANVNIGGVSIAEPLAIREGGIGFGTAVAVSGDTVVVGALNEASNATGVDGDQSDNSRSASGAAYVFDSNSGTWSQQAYLKASNAGAKFFFTWNVNRLVLFDSSKWEVPLFERRVKARPAAAS